MYGYDQQLPALQPAPRANVGPRFSVSHFLRWLTLPAAIGLVTGAAWWLLAPGGGLYESGLRPVNWLYRDLVFMGLATFAGLLIGVVLLFQQRSARFHWAVLAAILGGALGAVVQWLLGMMAGALWGPDTSATQVESVAFSLRIPLAVALWPLATAVVVFVAAILRGIFVASSPADHSV